MRRSRELLRLYISLRDLITKSPSSSTRSFPGLVIPFSSSFSSTLNGEDDKRSPKSQRDLLLLEKFRLRKLKGSSTTSEKIMEKNLKDEDERTEVVTNFKKLGLCEELIEVLEKLGVLVPSEIQCAGIPAVLEGKSVLMSSLSGHDRTLAYLLPLIQLLRQDRKLSHSNLKHPRAVVLCATEENAEQCFNAAKYIIRHAEFKSTKNDASLNNEQSDVSIGLVIGSPSEILQYIEEGTVIPEEIRYLVIDDADIMFDSDLGGEIHKIIRQLPDYTSNFATGGLQTVLVTSTLTEVLGEESPVIKHLENNHAGHVSAMLLEMDLTEVFQLTESMDALRQKMTEAMNSFLK